GALMGAPLIGYGLGGWLIHALGAAGALLVGVPLILALCAAALALPRLGAAQSGGRSQPLVDLRAGLDAIRSSPLLLAMLSTSFALNLAMNVMNTRAPVQMAVHGRGAADYAIFEMLISGGVLLGIALVTPLAARWSLDALIGAGRWVLVAGTLGFVLIPIAAWWAGAAVFGIGLGLLEVAATTRSQQLTGLEVRGRVIGALLALNAVGLSLGAGLAALPLPTPGLMLGLTALLLCLAPLWPVALRLQRLSASSSASANASSSSSQG
ncbi:MFS transporter, partial [Deinococcus frigens]